MSAVYKLSSDPRYHLVRMPPRYESHAPRPDTKAEREMLAFWEASTALANRTMFFIAFGWAAGVLWQLARYAMEPDLRRAAQQTLARHRYSVQLAPGPIGGGAA